MSKIVAAVTFCLAALAASPALADGSVSQTGLGNGSGADGFRPFDAIVRQYNASGERFRIDGHCQSACTLFLAIRNVCIVPSADIAFHAGHTRGPDRQIHQGATNHMLAAYKPRLRAYLKAGRYMETLAFHTLSGQDLITRFGYRGCP